MNGKWLTGGPRWGVDRKMRLRPHWILLFAGLIVGGCKSVEESGEPAASGSAKALGVEAASPDARPVVRPVKMTVGRVVAVNTPLRFIIADFPAGPLPRLDEVLSVYRLDMKVAEIRVSGPYRGTTVAADITAGEAREGDQVRPNP